LRKQPVESVSGLDVSAYFGARRYVVPPNFSVGQGRQTNEHPSLHRYTDIDRYEKMSHVFQAGEQVYVTEKIHGANSRVAMIDGELMVGSRKTQRNAPDYTEAFEGNPYKDNMYWFPLSIPGTRILLEDLGKSYKQVILFGEIYGQGIQGSFNYGRKGLAYAAFDLMLNGEYVSPAALSALLKQYDIPGAPVNYIGEFVPELIQYHVDAPSSLTTTHIREGVVIRPLNERRDARHGRVVAKWLNPAYLVKKSEDKIEDNQEV
jgi:RNA ligase (TIGR02306 family)